MGRTEDQPENQTVDQTESQPPNKPANKTEQKTTAQLNQTLAGTREKAPSFLETLEAELREQIRAELLAEFKTQFKIPSKNQPQHDENAGVTDEIRRQNLTQPTVAREHLELWLHARLDARFFPSPPVGHSAAWSGASVPYQQGRKKQRLDSSPSRSNDKIKKSNGPTVTRCAGGRTDSSTHCGATNGADRRDTVNSIRFLVEQSSNQKQHQLDAEDFAAVELIQRLGPALNYNFTAEELKAAYRRSALLVHPDRHAQSSPREKQNYARLFQDLTAAIKRLARHL